MIWAILSFYKRGETSVQSGDLIKITMNEGPNSESRVTVFRG